MGSNSSKVVEGGILIELEKPYYYPGEMIQGKIYLNFNQNYNSHGIELGLEVEEFGSFKVMKQRRENKRSRQYTKIRYGKRILFKSTQIIVTFHNGIVSSGQYVYPFSFILPPNLPGSFEYYDIENTAYIKYILEAKVISSNTKEHIKNEILVIVRQPPQFFQYPTRLTDTKNISTWCCLGKGTSTLNISYEKNYYCPDEKVNVICELDNTRCQLDATCIKLGLVQTITIRDKKNRTKYLSRKVAENRYESRYVLLYINSERRSRKYSYIRTSFIRCF
jgi:hypothetical protein